MKRLFMALLLVLLAAAVPALAGPPNITVVNQSGIDVTATLTSSTSQSDALAGNGTWTPGASPAATWTLRITRKTGPGLNVSKQLTPQTQTAYFRRTGQVFQIILSNDPPAK